MKKIGLILVQFIFVLVFFLCGQKVCSQGNENSIQVSLLTYSPGESLYSIFGHSAIRVKNTIANTDDVYNFGTFDFNSSKFYFGFVRGKLRYTLSKIPFELAFQQIQIENRSLIETPLNLSPSEKSKLTQLLRVNYLPENREYLYDFLYNNCSTKIIDLILEAASDSLEYNQRAAPNRTYRKLLNSYSKERPWVDIGIDLIMGIPADRRAKGLKISFLPDYLHLLLKNIRIKQEFGFEKSLAQSDIIHVNYPQQAQRIVIQPGIILYLLALILLVSAVLGTYIPGFFRIFEKTILIVFGSLGVIIILLWTATDHYIFNYNTDLLWANPLLLIIAFTKDSLRLLKIKVKLTYLLSFLVLAGILTTMVVEQNFNLTAFALMILIILLHKIKTFRASDIDPYYKG